MTPTSAELSSLASTLRELARRLSTLAEQAASANESDNDAAELFAVERALNGALRRLDRLAGS